MYLAIGIAIGLIAFVSFLFWKLEGITKFNVILYVFLLLFWIIISMFQTNFSTWKPTLPKWAWPLMLGIYQMTQALVRIPFGILSRKLKSRKQIIVITGVIALLGIAIFILEKGQIWSIIITMISIGTFGSTFGLQNQYWSENYNIKRVFTTIGTIALLPIIANFISVAISIKEANIDSYAMMWILTSLIIIGSIALIAYMVRFKEVKDAMRLDQDFVLKHKISKLELKDVLRISFFILPMSILIGLANPSQAADASVQGSYIPVIIAPLTSALATILVSFILVKRVKSFNLSIISRILFVLGMIFGTINYFINHSIVLEILFTIFSSIGFSMYAITQMGIMLHFDHKNTLLVLGIWLSIRSFGLSTGVIIEHELVTYANNSLKWVLLASGIFTLSTIPISLLMKNRTMLIYTMSDDHEHINSPFYSSVWKE